MTVRNIRILLPFYRRVYLSLSNAGPGDAQNSGVRIVENNYVFMNVPMPDLIENELSS